MKPAQSRPEGIFDVNVEDFEQQVLQPSHTQPILVDLWAEWCSPCRVIAPVLEQVVTFYRGRVLLAKVEVDEGHNMKLAGRYQVRGFPTLLLFEHGRVISRFSGARPTRFIEQFLEQHSTLLQQRDTH